MGYNDWLRSGGLQGVANGSMRGTQVQPNPQDFARAGMQNPKFAGPGSSAMQQMPQDLVEAMQRGGMPAPRQAAPNYGQNTFQGATPQQANHRALYAERHPGHTGGTPIPRPTPPQTGGGLLAPPIGDDNGEVIVTDPGGIHAPSGQVIRNAAHGDRLKAAAHQKDYAARHPGRTGGMVIPRVPKATVR